MTDSVANQIEGQVSTTPPKKDYVNGILAIPVPESAEATPSTPAKTVPHETTAFVPVTSPSTEAQKTLGTPLGEKSNRTPDQQSLDNINLTLQVEKQRSDSLGASEAKSELEKPLENSPQETTRKKLPLTIFLRSERRIPITIFLNEAGLPMCRNGEEEVSFVKSKSDSDKDKVVYVATIGRSLSQNSLPQSSSPGRVLVENMFVSQNHVDLRYEDGKLTIKNLSTTNQVFVPNEVEKVPDAKKIPSFFEQEDETDFDKDKTAEAQAVPAQAPQLAETDPAPAQSVPQPQPSNAGAAGQ